MGQFNLRDQAIETIWEKKNNFNSVPVVVQLLIYLYKESTD